MRLLQIKQNGCLELTSYLVEDIPKYAILSHTWLSDDEEVSFEDWANGNARDKAGFPKIQFCMEQAARDGLEYLWVDTCCINKSSSTELQESVISMFNWYRNAARCYVYLADVSVPEDVATDQVPFCVWESAFRTSRWFTRGW